MTVTVRQYRSGMVNIPFGCKRINYGERMDYLPKCDLVVSATASPNFTLREELFENLELEKSIVTKLRAILGSQRPNALCKRALFQDHRDCRSQAGLGAQRPGHSFFLFYCVSSAFSSFSTEEIV